MWKRQVERVEARAVFVHVAVRLNGAVLIKLNLDAELAVELAVGKVRIGIDASLWSLNSRVEEVHPVDVRWGLLSAIELDISIQTTCVPNRGDERAADERLTVVILPLILLWPSHDVLDL